MFRFFDVEDSVKVKFSLKTVEQLDSEIENFSLMHKVKDKRRITIQKSENYGSIAYIK